MVYCSICDAERECDILLNYSNEYNLCYCYHCGLIFLHPEPKIELADNLYSGPKSFYNYLPPNNFKLKIKKLKIRLAFLRFNNWQGKSHHNFIKYDIPKFIVSSLEFLSGMEIPYTMGIPASMPRDAAILDIGYGDGSWLLAMQDMGYFNLSGIEFNSTAQSTLLGKQINALVGDIRDFDFSDESFDIIRLEHVFEHLPDPLKLMQKMSTWLKSSGFIVMTVPNIQSLDFKIFGEHFAYLSLPLHFYHYSTESLKNLCNKCGLQVLKCRTLAVWSGFANSLKSREDNWLAKLLNTPLARIMAPIYALSVSGKGDLLSVVLSKTASQSS